MNSGAQRRLFTWFNRLFMVPVFRLGLGPLIGNPLTGYIMVLRTVGRRSGRPRLTPVNYAILDGCVYCVAGYGKTADWYRNARSRPAVELLLPGGTVAGTAEAVDDPDEAARALRQVLTNGGFAGFFLGFNPRTAPEAVLRRRAAGIPVLRIRPTGLGSGAADPGGWLWILALAVLGWLLIR